MGMGLDDALLLRARCCGDGGADESWRRGDGLGAPVVVATLPLLLLRLMTTPTTSSFQPASSDDAVSQGGATPTVKLAVDEHVWGGEEGEQEAVLAQEVVGLHEGAAETRHEADDE